jgi:hypothetical protein
MKIYIGCALTHSPYKYREYITKLIDRISSINGVELLRFHSNPLALGGGEHADVYLQDIHQCIMKADAMIADCTYPSTGLGWEIGAIVEARKKPVLAMAKEGAKVTRLLLGAECDKNPLFNFKYYKSEEEANRFAEGFIYKLINKP